MGAKADKLDPEGAAGMEKLMRRGKPVRVLRRISALSRARATLDTMKQVSNEGRGILARFKAILPGVKQDQPYEKQVVQAQALVDQLENDWIEGVLTPLTEAEAWAVRAHYTHLSLYLTRQLTQEGNTPEKVAANAAATETVDILGNQAWMAKWVGYSLKRTPEDGRRTATEPYWPEAIIPADLDPMVIGQLFSIYHEAFTPTEAELKKSAAPTTPRTN
jgi:hypothetical protein